MKSLILLLAFSGQDVARPVPPDVAWQSPFVYVVVPTIRLGILPVWLVQPVKAPNPFYQPGEVL